MTNNMISFTIFMVIIFQVIQILFFSIDFIWIVDFLHEHIVSAILVYFICMNTSSPPLEL